MQINDVLLYFALKYSGDYKKMFIALQNNEAININDFSTMKKNNLYKVVTIRDENYPNELKMVKSPPILLFYNRDEKIEKNALLVDKIVFDDQTRGFILKSKQSINDEDKELFIFACENDNVLSSIEKYFYIFND